MDLLSFLGYIQSLAKLQAWDETGLAGRIMNESNLPNLG